jgi:uncharacterized protein YbaA (DUF1428 family)
LTNFRNLSVIFPRFPSRASRRIGSRPTPSGQVVREYGGLSYREFRGGDLGDALKTADCELLTAAVAEFESRAHRDEVMEKVLEDPRVTALEEGEQVTDMGQMRYGGFETFSTPSACRRVSPPHRPGSRVPSARPPER